MSYVDLPESLTRRSARFPSAAARRTINFRTVINVTPFNEHSMSPRTACFAAMPIAIAMWALLTAGDACADERNGSLWSKVETSLSQQDELGRQLTADAAEARKTAGSAMPTRLVLAMQAHLSPQSSVVFERSGAAPQAGPPLASPPTTVNTKMGLEFRPVSDVSLKQLGSLRLQLAGNSSLLIRPRSGGLALSWRSQF